MIPIQACGECFTFTHLSKAFNIGIKIRAFFSSKANLGSIDNARPFAHEKSARSLLSPSDKTQPKFRQRESWQTQKDALEHKFGSVGWRPRKRLSPDALEGIRSLNSQYPEKYTTPVLADQFQISPEAVRRILKSKWRPKDNEIQARRQRWDRRGEAIWTRMVEIGVKPPKKWRDMGIGQKDKKQSVKDEDKKLSIRKFRSDKGITFPGQAPNVLSNTHESISEVPLSERIL